MNYIELFIEISPCLIPCPTCKGNMSYQWARMGHREIPINAWCNDKQCRTWVKLQLDDLPTHINIKPLKYPPKTARWVEMFHRERQHDPMDADGVQAVQTVQGDLFEVAP